MGGPGRPLPSEPGLRKDSSAKVNRAGRMRPQLCHPPPCMLICRPPQQDEACAPMANRWMILAVLFGVRVAMAFQFQLVAALAPEFRRSFDASIGDIGLLISLYLAAGAALAFPGG